VRWAPVLLLLFALPGCDATRPAEAEPAYARTFETDGLRLALSLSHTSARTVDRLRFHVELEAAPALGDPSIEIPITPAPEDWPDGMPRFGQFRVVTTSSAPERISPEGRLRIQRTLTLEPFLPGAYTAPAVTVRAGDRSVTSEPIDITVTSVLASEDAPGDVAPLRTRDVPGNQPRVPAWVVGSLTLVLVAGGAWFAWFASRRRARGGGRDPRAVATARLASLSAEPVTGRASERLDEVAWLLALAGRPHDDARAGDGGHAMAERLDRARFGGVAVADDEAEAMTREAAELVRTPAGTPGGDAG